MDSTFFKKLKKLLKNESVKYINTENNLILICYNTKLLDNIRYEAKLYINKLYELSSSFKPYNDIKQIYDLFIQIIENKRFEIKKDLNFLDLIIIITDMLSNTIKVSIHLKDSNYGKRDDYLNILSKEIISFRKQKEELNEIKKEQNDFKKEIEELKKMI